MKPKLTAQGGLDRRLRRNAPIVKAERSFNTYSETDFRKRIRRARQAAPRQRRQRFSRKKSGGQRQPAESITNKEE